MESASWGHQDHKREPASVLSFYAFPHCLLWVLKTRRTWVTSGDTGWLLDVPTPSLICTLVEVEWRFGKSFLFIINLFFNFNWKKFQVYTGMLWLDCWISIMNPSPAFHYWQSSVPVVLRAKSQMSIIITICEVVRNANLYILKDLHQKLWGWSPSMCVVLIQP